ncbi:hypothetical protein RUM44_013768 [Polyplax serrata]|uniref:Transmembrane protein n=1 Tax=Polyplax serrata TaxID=468196 RepID=A0ABR1BF25_POLSC
MAEGSCQEEEADKQQKEDKKKNKKVPSLSTCSTDTKIFIPKFEPIKKLITIISLSGKMASLAQRKTKTDKRLFIHRMAAIVVVVVVVDLSDLIWQKELSKE